MSKSPSSVSAAAVDENLAPTVGTLTAVDIDAACAADSTGGSEAAAAKGKESLSSSVDEEYVPRMKKGHWSYAEPFGSWPPYDSYDDIKEVDSDDVDSDDDSRNDKRRHVLAKLERGDYTYQHAENNFSCPFYSQKIDTDFNSVVMHAESLGSCNVRVGESVNKSAFIAKHAAFEVHLRKLRALDMELGVVQPPKVPKEKSIEQCVCKCLKCRCLMIVDKSD